MADWSAAVLAGGQGRRLGGVAKPLIPIGGRPVLARQLEVLQTLGAVPRLVAPDPTPYTSWPLHVQRDVCDGGALGGLYTALVTAPTPYVLVIAGDLPFLTAPFLRHLIDVRPRVDVVLAAPDGRYQPLCAFYAADAATHLRAALDARRLRVTDALTGLRVHVVDGEALTTFDPHGHLLHNLNTAADVAAADQHARGMGGRR